MAKRKLSVTHNGQTFTRSTERIYTHAILVRSDYQRNRTLAESYGIERARDNYDYYVREANPDTRKYSHTPADLAHFAEVAAMSLDQYAQKLRDEAVAKVDAQHAAGDYDRFGVLAWCGRPDLAQKEADKARNSRANYAEVVIVEVPPAA